MKKRTKLYFSFAVVFIIAIIFINCDMGNGNNDNNGNKEVDSRLWTAGGEWGGPYNFRTTPWYTFTRTTMTINPGNFVTGIPVSVYTKNGGVYLLETDTLILAYRQYTEADFSQALEQAIASGNQQAIFAVHNNIEKAKTGFFMKFTVQGVSADYNNWPGLIATGRW